MFESMSNTRRGGFRVNAGEALSDYANRLAVLADAGSESEVLLPTTLEDLALYLVLDGAAHDATCDVLPIHTEQQVRVRAKGTGSAGAVLVLADPGTAADRGKVRAIPATAGRYFSPGIAEEDFVDGQLVAVRPLPRIVNVKSADSLTALTFSATVTAAEADALRDAVLAILVAQGLVASA